MSTRATRGEELVAQSPAPTDTDNLKKRRRIPRACDRCRLKKSKCDGARVCKACQATDSTCLYRTRRNREAKNYYWYMRDITDEALIRLYWACQNGTGFPGHSIEERKGKVTAHAVLEGLGLTGPIEDDAANKGVRGSPTRAICPLQALPRETPTPPLSPDESSTSANTSSANSRTNSLPTIDTVSAPESTRLQRQFQKQLQSPATSTAPPFNAIVAQPQSDRYSMDTSSYSYTHSSDHDRDFNKSSIQPDVPRFDLPLAPKVAPPEPHIGEGLLASQFFDFENAGITPGLNLENFDFTYPHEFTAAFPT